MAHQAHNLSWNTLASHFKFVPRNRKYHNQTNLYPCFRPNQARQLAYFVNAFASVMEEYSKCERSRYPECEPAGWSEVVIPPATAQKIRPSLDIFRSNSRHQWYTSHANCDARETNCVNGCISPFCWRAFPVDEYMSCWLRLNLILHGQPVYTQANAISYTCALRMHDEMGTLLRIAAHPAAHLEKAWKYPAHHALLGNGWCKLVRSTLMAYVCLNVFYLKPETWAPAFRKQFMKGKTNTELEETDYDYRNTSAYQKMLTRCTYAFEVDVHTHPHRQFFGVPYGMYEGHSPASPPTWLGDRTWRGIQGDRPLKELRSKGYENFYMPHRLDIPVIIAILGKKGLPVELSLIVLEFAAYVPQRRLPVADDPLHPGNASELAKYLRYCWQLLVRADILVKARERRIDWHQEVSHCIFELFGVGYPKMIEFLEVEYNTEFVRRPGRIMRFV